LRCQAITLGMPREPELEVQMQEPSLSRTTTSLLEGLFDPESHEIGELTDAYEL